MFGSVARNRAGEASDVDLAFDVAPDTVFDAFDMGGVVMDLMGALGQRVDLVERRSMSPEFAARIAPDIVRIF
ncbi:nucleotidyltransferase domain-containing protein [Brevundimonas sp. M20]|uniref:nucleotidyltransferase family protein n=1 Tax=Brevundimonas sp. M20 TaxID=2591463 RepID=UPI00143CF839